MKQLLLIPVVLCTFFACDGEQSHPEFDASEFWIEHHKSEWDSLSTTQHLLGTWNWVYNVCCPMLQGFKGEFTSEQNVQVTFTSEQITVTKDGEEIESGEWFVEFRDGELFGVTTNPFISRIGGRILFKDDYVLFNNSYVDGADNYFRKTRINFD